ncbi:MAG: NADH-quinone oxidoreductase subunit C [Halothiobacillaceae bacterium]|nr:MAG: NADH-quinone oxidoreductase subunit C [Halothiobacillaceae bacterium]
MAKTLEQIRGDIQARFPGRIADIVIENEELTVELAPEDLPHVCEVLRSDVGFSYEQLVDLCGVDYSDYGKSEWLTDDKVCKGGYNRGVQESTAGRMKFGDDLPLAGSDRPRFAVVYHLLSYRHNTRLRLRVYCAEESLPVVPSVVDIWSGANWFEREAFDLFGILFDGHPDLRRILTDYGFVGHPFRKDFPLIGHVEMRYDETKGRVVYEPVSIEPRVLVPRVIRHDHRFILSSRKKG